MIVVADTTPLLYLSSIGRLELLRILYDDVLVPRTVWNEAVTARPTARGVQDLREASWLSISDAVEASGVDPSLSAALDQGEAAAIMLAERVRANLLLIDEKKGRAMARQRGLRIRGTLGVLVEARRGQHITSLRIAVDELSAQGFRIAPALVAEALARVGED